MDEGPKLDKRFASAVSFRQVHSDAPRIPSIGTVIRKADNKGEFLLCITPKCDSVRLTEISSFLFLPLSDARQRTHQVVIKISENELSRKTVELNPLTWSTIKFKPDCKSGCLLTAEQFKYTDINDVEYEWVGELKPEYAQLIANDIVQRMSRVPINKSEWLRRSE